MPRAKSPRALAPMSVPVAVDPEFTLESPLAPRASPGGRTQPAGAADGTLTNGDDHATQYSDYGMTANVRQGLIAHEVGDSSSSDGLMVNGSAEDFPSVSKTSRRNRLLLIGGVTTVVTTIIAVCIYLAIMSRRRSGCQDSSVDSCALLCSGILLQTIQFSGLFNDSKTFVDMPMVNSPQCVLDDFNSLSDYSPSSLYTFVERNFEQSCTDMLPWSPPDYDDEPKFLDKIEDKILKEWTYDVHALWNLLGRQVSPDVYENPLRHTLLRLRSPHMIVPGGRFCEFYYWDSYWILQGLLVSGMYATAKGIVDNFLGLVEDYGFVPNGSRKYYLNRSQPPMLTLMVKEIVDAQGDTEWMTSILPTLEIEYNYWMDPGTRALQVPDSQGNVHTLNRYYSDSDRPRPESYVADSITAWLLYNMTTSAAQAEKTQHHKRHLEPLDFSAVGLKTLNDARLYQSTQDYRDLSHFTSRSTSRSSSESVDASSSSPSSPHLPPAPPVPDFSNSSAIHALFSQLTAGAESGWDFSSRWFHDRSNLTSVETMDLIPVDLNAILYKVEVQLAEFWNIAGNEDKAKQYTAAAQARMVAIHSILYNATGSQWQDYHIDKRYWKSEVMISNWIPLWAKCYDSSLVDDGSVISSLLQSGLVMSGGIVTTLNNNTQQWDFPNAWAPLQWMIVRGINSSVYRSDSTIDNFTIYNSTALPKGQAPPAHACDIIHPEHWYNCTSSDDLSSCSWCFPSATSLSTALALRWMWSNFLAFNETGYMLEKYYAPTPGGVGAGGEYKLQKGFGWTNGVALDFMTRLSDIAPEKLTIEYLQQQPFPYAEMAPKVDTSPLVPEHPPNVISAHPIEKSHYKYQDERSHPGDRKRSKKAGDAISRPDLKGVGVKL